MVLYHAFDVEFFDGNHAEAVDNSPCVLMAEIMATVSDALVDAGKNLVGFAPLTSDFITTSLPSFGLFASCFRQRLLITAEEARVLNELAIRQSSEGFHSNIYANRLGRRRQYIGRDLTGNADEPFARLPP